MYRDWGSSLEKKWSLERDSNGWLLVLVRSTLPLERLKKRSFYPKVRISDIFSQRSDWPRSRHSNSDQFVPRGFELRTITTTLQRGLTVLPTRADERSDKEIKCDENVREIKKGPGFQPKKLPPFWVISTFRGFARTPPAAEQKVTIDRLSSHRKRGWENKSSLQKEFDW